MTILLVAALCAGIVMIAGGLAALMNGSERFVLLGGIGVGGLAMTAISMLLLGADAEIAAKDYARIEGWVAADPALRPMVAHDLADGRIDGGELADITKAHDRDDLIMTRDRLRRQVAGAGPA